MPPFDTAAKMAPLFGLRAKAVVLPARPTKPSSVEPLVVSYCSRLAIRGVLPSGAHCAPIVGSALAWRLAARWAPGLIWVPGATSRGRREELALAGAPNGLGGPRRPHLSGAPVPLGPLEE